jgi:hypothetical protein
MKIPDFLAIKIEQVVAIGDPEFGPAVASHDAAELLKDIPTIKKIFIQFPDMIVTVERRTK